MKLKLIIFPLCLIVINAFGFEGSIKQVVKNYNGTGATVTMNWQFGPHNCRVDMAASGKDVNSNTVLILDPASRTLKTYEANASGAQKLYFQVDASSISASLSVISVSPTQEVKQINGYKCEKWLVVTSAGAYNVWVTRDIDIDWSVYKDFFKSSIEVQALANQGVKGFPMLTESANGTNNASVESVSAQSVAANAFSVPSEYTLYVAQK
jgi:hypothetical protein